MRNLIGLLRPSVRSSFRHVLEGEKGGLLRPLFMAATGQKNRSFSFPSQCRTILVGILGEYHLREGKNDEIPFHH